MTLAPASSRGVDLSAANVWTGNQTAPALIASGLTGATAASRYVGATASGAPASGTFAIGDYIIDQTGKLYVCTTAGTPGTWTQVGGSGVTQLAYQEKTSTTNITGTTESGATTIVTAAAITADGATRICVEVFAFSCDPGGVNQLDLPLFDSFNAGAATSLGTMASIYGSTVVPVLARRFLTPASGTHAYSWRGYKSAGTVSIYGNTGGAGLPVPAYIRVTSGG